jgi:ABC-type glycerol-3-phosphate transport system substrate-binding protein
VKIRSLLLSAAASLALLLNASCDVVTADDPDTVVLDVWQGFKFEEVTVLERISAEFKARWEAENPGKTLEIRLNRVSYDDMVTKLKTAALADQTPDLAFVDSMKVVDLAYGQTLTPLDELESFKERYGTREKAREEFIGASFDMGDVTRLGQRNLYGLPVQTTTLALFWNRRIFRQKADALRAAGLDPNRAPADWDELVAYSRVIEDKPNLFGYAMNGSLWFHFPIYNQYDVDWIRFESNGRAVPDVDNEKGLAALKRISGLWLEHGIEAGGWKPGAMGPDQGFINERYAMILMGPWMVEKFVAAGLDFDIALVPAVPAEEARRLGIDAASSSNIGGQTGVIFQSCEEPDLAFEFIDYFVNEKNQREWAESLGQIPVRLTAWEGLNFEKFPFVPKFMEQLKYAKRLPGVPLYATVESSIYSPEFQLVMLGRNTPEKALARLEVTLNREILDQVNARLDGE